MIPNTTTAPLSGSRWICQRSSIAPKMNATDIHSSVSVMYSARYSSSLSLRSVGIAVLPPGQRGTLSISKR